MTVLPSLRQTLLLGVLGLSGAAGAQISPPSPATPPAVLSPATAPATLPDVLGWLRSAPGWQAADYAYRASELQLQAARLRAGVTLSAGANLSAARIPWDGGEWAGNSTLSLMLSASVLPWSPAREALRSAERAHQVAATDLRRARADLTVQAVRAYAGGQQAAAALSLATAQRDLASQGLQVAQAQRAAGVIPAEALLERQAALQNAEAGQTQAGRAVSLAAAQLRRLLGREVTLPPAGAPLGFRVTDTDEARLIARALSTRPETARAQASVLDAQAGVRAAELDARLPDLSAAGQFGEIGTSEATSGRRVTTSFNLKTGVASAQATLPLAKGGAAPPSGAVLSLSANLPLLGRTQGGALAQARLGLEQAQLALENARQSVTLDVRTRLSEYLDEQGSLAGLDTTVTRARTLLEAARARQEVGTATLLEVRQAELTLTQAQNALAAAQQRVALAALGLMEATGDLDPFLLTILPPLPVAPGGQ